MLGERKIRKIIVTSANEGGASLRAYQVGKIYGPGLKVALIIFDQEYADKFKADKYTVYVYDDSDPRGISPWWEFVRENVKIEREHK